ncbi:putative RNA recognition motif domain, nucleotide-binding alpha-beta plait domain superfamily [Septoria linicola]|nr:putative RNA recognition motif domain, nucleotide-binding alpha-beta plait domain superfamily [Septoria linicola]
MAEPGMDDEDLFADLYDGDDNANEAPAAAVKAEPDPQDAADAAAAAADDFLNQQQQQQQAEPTTESNEGNNFGFKQEQSYDQNIKQEYRDPTPDNRPLIGSKEDGKMFIGGLNWETTDQSLKDYFTQFGEVVECTVMRDGATGRSRGFGFLTFKDPKTVNTVMVKEHSLDGKLIDPKRAIPRDEQERTAKIFVGGVSQDATEQDFEAFFQKFGRVLDATLMMDKDTGRPRGFGFVTFDNEIAVERTLEGPLAILGKPIEVKRAQPRGKMGEEENTGGRGGFGGGRGGRGGGGGFGGGGRGDGGFNNQQQMAGPQGGDGNNPNNMTPAMMAQYWQRMQQYFAQMQAMQQGGGMNPMMGGMNPMMMQQMQAMRAQQGGGQMNPQMMQQMMQQGGFQGNGSPMNGGAGRGAPNNNGNGGQGSAFTSQEQLMFEQQKYERQTMARMQGQNFGGQNTWDGMYDDVPAPDGMAPGRGGFGGRGGRGGRQGSAQPTPPNAPAGAPTGPKNHGKPGANYRGGGRGGRGGGFHPYARGGA